MRVRACARVCDNSDIFQAPCFLPPSLHSNLKMIPAGRPLGGFECGCRGNITKGRTLASEMSGACPKVVERNAEAEGVAGEVI